MPLTARTATGPEPAPAGTVTVNFVRSELTAVGTAVTPPAKVTTLALAGVAKFWPWIVTGVPAAAWGGETREMLEPAVRRW
ncbi:hypothetical protein D3C86_714470 [compost metagenome]